MMDKLLGTLGLARKAGKLEIGEEPCASAARAKSARLILVAKDAADNSRRRAGHFADIAKCPLAETGLSKEELGTLTGRLSCAMVAVCDPAFAHMSAAALAQSNEEKFGAMAAELRDKAERFEQRKREKRAYEKNKRLGRKK